MAGFRRLVTAVISVIIPTYNRAPYLERAIDSVLAQDRACDEVIVVDDGSTDATPILVERLAAASVVPVRLLRQENRGAAAARNLGIRRSRYPLLAFLDSDDWWLPNKLSLQASAMAARPDVLISHTREFWFRQGQRVNQKKKHDPPNGDIFAPSLGMCVVGMSTVMARRELFDRYGLFDESLPCCEDYDLWLRVGCRQSFLLVPEPLTGKDGGRPDQLSDNPPYGHGHFSHSFAVPPARRRRLESGAAAGRTVAELVRKCTIYGQGCIKHGRSDEGAHYLNLAADYQSSREHTS